MEQFILCPGGEPMRFVGDERFRFVQAGPWHLYEPGSRRVFGETFVAYVYPWSSKSQRVRCARCPNPHGCEIVFSDTKPSYSSDGDVLPKSEENFTCHVG